MVATRRVGRYRSGLERTIAELLDKTGVPYAYEPCKLKYTRPESKHTYTPDLEIGDTFFEIKGRLTATDRKKMILVRDQNPDKKIIFIFDRSTKKLSKASNTTYGDWCDKNGFKYYDLKQMKEETKCILSTTKLNSDLKSVKSPRKKKTK